VHFNVRIMSRNDEGSNKGAMKFWDINRDACNQLNDGVGLPKLAQSNLDRLDLETMPFMDDDNEGEDNETVSIR